MDMKKGITFISKQDLETFLHNRLDELSMDQEYNIMAHEIQHTKNKSTNKHLQCIMSDIFKHGFDVNGYPTVFGTMSLLGSSNNHKSASNIVNYNYYSNQKNKIICLLAIPKYVIVDEKTIEFSSFNGTSSKMPDKDLDTLYKKHGYSPDLHDYKCCLLDLIKSRLNLPRCYTLGAIEIDHQSGQYIYYNNDTHLSYQNNDFKTQLNQDIEKKTLSLFKKYQTTDLKEIIVGEYQEELKWINEKLDFDI